MRGSIPLHPEHGLNPSVVLCFWCGEGKGVALVGRKSKKIFGTEEAPRQFVEDYHFCEKCMEEAGDGIKFIEVNPNPNAPSQPPMPDGVYPTGRYVVVEREAVANQVTPPELAADILKKGACYVNHEDFEELFKGALDAQGEE